MVFSSVPVYLDPPNWPEQSHPQPGAVAGCERRLIPTLPPPPPPGGGGGSSGAINPGSIAERARLARIPQPEAALKCPRCESTNTKFCYYNNYSLWQPRHLCKTCRRYWTRGGALRNVPVGGGCRSNKRSKRSSRSKSPIKAGSSSGSGLDSNNCTTDIIGHILPQPPQLPIWPPFQHLGEHNSTAAGLNFGGIQPPEVDTGSGGAGAAFQMNSTSSRSHTTGSLLSSTGPVDQQWRLQLQVQQFPFFANLEPPTGLYPFEVGRVDDDPRNHVAQLSSKPLDTANTQPSTAKMEDSEGLIFPKNFMGLSGNDDQYWGGNAWTDLPGFSSSSTSHLL